MEIRFYLLVKRLKVAWAAQACVHFMKALSVNALNPHLLTLKAYITTLSYVFIVYWNIMKPLKQTLFASILLLNNKQTLSNVVITLIFRFYLLPRSHIHGSPRRFYCGLNLTDGPGNANIRSPIRMHYIRMIKYYYVWLRMQYGTLRTNMDFHEWCRIVSVANPASGPWMCDLGICLK